VDKMAEVKEYLQNLLNARYGKDVRQSIHDSIQAINAQVEEAETSALASAQIAKENADIVLAISKNMTSCAGSIQYTAKEW
jgi:protein associated with RNAse G/E